MREIKLRAWHKINKQMLEFDSIALVKFGADATDVYYERSKLLGYRQDFEESANLEIMQYTGHKDSKGKEIYEHDIISITLNDFSPYTASTKRIIGVVYWDDENCGLWLDLTKPAAQASLFPEGVDPGKKGGPFTGFYGKRAAVSEVIGNIYENKELLDA